MTALRVLAYVLCLWSAGSASAASTDPNIAVVEKFHGALLDTMKQGQALGIEGRYKKLEPAVDAAFELSAMTKFAVGPAWSAMSDDDHKSLITAFRRMTIASYARNFDEFKGQLFTVDPNVEIRGADRLVKSQIIPQGQKPVNLVYRIRESSGAPKFIDVIYEYVSQIATKRADFASTIKSGGATALVKKLNEISDKLMTGA